MTPTRPGAPAQQHSVDVFIFGPELAGAVAGALLTRRGYHVLALAHGDLSPTYVHGPWQLPRGPSLLPQLRQLPAATSVLDELGLSTDVGRAQTAAHPPLQILAPGARLDFHPQPAQRLSELRRALGADGEEQDRFIQRLLAWDDECTPFFRGDPPLPPGGWLDRMKLRKQLARFTKLRSGPPADGLAPALQALASFASYLRSTSGAGLRPLAQLLRGPMVTPGGEFGLASLIRQRMVAHGAGLLDDPAIRLVELAGTPRTAVEARTSKGQKIRARYFIAALSGHELPALVPALEGNRRFAAKLAGVTPRRAVLTLNLILHPPGIPPGLGPAALALPGGRAEQPLLVQVGPARQPGGAERAEQLMTLSARIDCSALASAEGSRRGAEAMKAAAAEFFPFLTPHIALESSAQIESPSRQWHDPEIEVSLPQQLGVTGLPIQTPLNNLALAGPEALPGLGLEGQFLTGSRIATLVQRALPKRDLLK